jgi:ribosome-associated protein
MKRVEMTDNDKISIDPGELAFEAVQAGGPGGQNVNKVATAVLLRFDLDNSPSLSEDVKRRLRTLAGKRYTKSGEIVIRSMEFRTQVQNRQAAEERLMELITEAQRTPVKRHATKPSYGARLRRLAGKKHQSQKKQTRAKRWTSED